MTLPASRVEPSAAVAENVLPAGTDLAEVSDLLPGTSYVVYAYDGETYKGKKLFKTAADIAGMNKTLITFLSQVVIFIANYILSKVFVFKNSDGQAQESRND